MSLWLRRRRHRPSARGGYRAQDLRSRRLDWKAPAEPLAPRRACCSGKQRRIAAIQLIASPNARCSASPGGEELLRGCYEPAIFSIWTIGNTALSGGRPSCPDRRSSGVGPTLRPIVGLHRWPLDCSGLPRQGFDLSLGDDEAIEEAISECQLGDPAVLVRAARQLVDPLEASLLDEARMWGEIGVRASSSVIVSRFTPTPRRTPRSMTSATATVSKRPLVSSSHSEAEAASRPGPCITVEVPVGSGSSSGSGSSALPRESTRAQ